jgi:hypothetical protein
MAARQQRIRLHFLIALTVAVAAFGVNRFLATYRREQRRTEYVRTEREIRRYTRELLEAEHEELEAMARAGPRRVRSDAAALLMQARYLSQQAQDRRAAGGRERDGSLATLKANFGRLRAGEPPSFPKGEAFLRGYYAEVDGTFQPYGVCLPRGYDPDAAHPVIITLHGHGGFDRFQCLNAPCYEGAISVKPQGRGSTDFMHLGEDDVLAVLEDVRALYNVDAERVYLTGYSMGATGAWHLAVHHPDLFAGIAPMSGNADHHVWEQSWGWNAGAAGHERLRGFLHDSLSPVSYAENLLHCSVVALHGAGDSVVPVGHSRSMVGRLRELGYDFEYLELPQASHSGLPDWARQYALSKAFGSVRPRRPKRTVYTATHPRHGRAWWLELDRLDSPVRFATVKAAAADGTVDLVTENVAALTVLTGELPVKAEQITVDGARFVPPPQTAGSPFVLEKWNGAWRPADPARLMKREGLSGPFSDVLRDPFLVVYGTEGDSALMREISAGEAERFAAEWEKRYGEAPRLKSDAEVTPADAARFNLLLFGGPGVNRLSREVCAAAPFGVSEEAVLLGGEEFTGRDVGLLVCYPNPALPARMAALVAGTTPAALYQAADRPGRWFNWGACDKYKWFDYAVFDAATAGPESYLAVGFFDNRWRRLPDGGGPAGGGAEWRKDAAASAGLRPQGFPALASAAEGEEGEVMLSDVRPLAIDQHRGAVGFDRSYAGRAIRLAGRLFGRGLGVKAPSSLSFALGGRFRTFEATVGLTPGLKPELSPARLAAEEVTFEVWGDGRQLAASPPLSWREGGRSWSDLSASVRGVEVLTLRARPKGKATWLYGACAWGAPTVTR